MPSFDDVKNGVGGFFNGLGTVASMPYTPHPDWNMYGPGQDYVNPETGVLYHPGQQGYPGVGSNFGAYATMLGSPTDGYGNPDYHAPSNAGLGPRGPAGAHPYDFDVD
jgi:hypothetical protein